MIGNVGWAEILVLLVVGLVVLGPERLPDAARWIARAIRKVKEFAKSAESQLKDDFGTDFDEFREPLQQINSLRGMTPRALVTKHLLDGDDSLFTGDFDAAAPNTGGSGAGDYSQQAPAQPTRAQPSQPAQSQMKPQSRPPASTPRQQPTEPPAAGGSVGWGDIDAT